MKTNHVFLFILFFAFSILIALSSCEKDPEIITETITIHDTIVVVDTFVVVETVFESIPDTATTFILVRHAETTDGGSNPNLSPAGQARAIELSRILTHVDIGAIYSTDFNRTMQTAQSVATAQGKPVLSYDPFAPEILVDQSLVAYPKGVILVVGHSNTTADILNVMVGAQVYQDIPEGEYDNLFVVQVSERGDATVIHLKYGM